jgi:chromosome segregation ATPase
MIQLNRRLEIIQSAIAIEDEKLIDMQLVELHAHKNIESIQSIITSLSNYDYNTAIQSVNDFIKQRHGLIAVGQEEINSLKFELKSLENKRQGLSEQLNEINGEIQDFTHEYSFQLGNLIRELLKSKAQVSEVKIKAKYDHFEQAKDEGQRIKEDAEQVSAELDFLLAELETLDEFSDEYEDKHEEYLNKQKDYLEKEVLVSEQRNQVREAKVEMDDIPEQQEYESIKQDEAYFENEYCELVDVSLSKLTKDELKALKKCYKNAVFLCHPDTVADEFKEQAHDGRLDFNG